MIIKHTKKTNINIKNVYKKLLYLNTNKKLDGN